MDTLRSVIELVAIVGFLVVKFLSLPNILRSQK